MSTRTPDSSEESDEAGERGAATAPEAGTKAAAARAQDAATLQAIMPPESAFRSWASWAKRRILAGSKVLAGFALHRRPADWHA